MKIKYLEKFLIKLSQTIFILILLLCSILIFIHVSQQKNKKINLNNNLVEKASIYYKEKYGEELKVDHIDIVRSSKTATIENEGYVFLDEEETKHIYVNLNNYNLDSMKIGDNIQAKDLLNDLKSEILSGLEDYNIEIKAKISDSPYNFFLKDYYDGEFPKEYVKDRTLSFDVVGVMEAKENVSYEDIKNKLDENGERIFGKSRAYLVVVKKGSLEDKKYKKCFDEYIKELVPYRTGSRRNKGIIRKVSNMVVYSNDFLIYEFGVN